MSPRRFHQTTITVTILSEQPILDEPSLEDLGYQITQGGWSGSVRLVASKTLNAAQAVTELRRQGSDPEFFGLKPDGSDLED